MLRSEGTVDEKTPQPVETIALQARGSPPRTADRKGIERREARPQMARTSRLMVAPREPLEDLTITTTVERPSRLNPDGRIIMTAETIGQDGLKTEEVVQGADDDVTRLRVLQHSYAYMQNSRKSHVANLRRNGRDDHDLGR